MPISQKGPRCKSQEQRRTIRTLLPGGLPSACCQVLFCILSSSLAVVQRLSSPPIRLPSAPLTWCLLALAFFLQDPHFESLHPTFFTILTISFMISLIGSDVNPVESCTASGHFSPAGLYCFWLGGFQGSFYNSYGIISGRILPDSHDVLSAGFSDIALTSLFTEHHV